MPVIAVTSLDQYHKIINENKVNIFDFWAAWCGPCRAINPVFEKLSDQTLSVGFYKVDVDAARDIADEVGIRSMPTFIAYRNGSKAGEIVGANSQMLENLIRQYA